VLRTPGTPHLRKRGAVAAAVLLLPTVATGAAGQTFSQALDLARGKEPTYLSAIANVSASRERSKQAIAGLLPQITASATTNANHRDYVTNDAPIPPTVDRYNSNSRQINITQPLWRHASIIASKQAQTMLSQAEQQLAAAEQELSAKLVAAWCDVMSARDNVVHSARQALATKQQLDILSRGVQLGSESPPALAEATAKHEQALSDQVSAEMEMNLKTALLEQLTGPLTSFHPPFLTPRPELEDLSAESLAQWLQVVEVGSPLILSAEQALIAANDEVRKQRAGHQPTLDLVGSYGYNAQSVGNFPGQNGYEITQGIVGLQLTIPLYTGGGQSAKVGEALALQEKARQELEAARRAARLTVKQAWFLWRAGRARHLAALKALRSYALALEAASRGKGAGLGTDLEVLRARQQLEGARRDLNRAYYDMIVSVIKLKAIAGKLTEADLRAFEKLFVDREADLNDLLAAN